MPTRSKGRPHREYIVVGVTGGIGSGKSSVCGVFQHLGRTVLSADMIAREISETDPGARGRIRQLLGDEVYLPDGSFDRVRVADRVFTDARLLAQLNAIVHPRVFAALEKRIDALSPEERRPYVIVEAALIYESGMDRRLDKIVVVDAPEEARITRVMARDRVSRESVELRIRAQMPAAAKVSRADFVIHNGMNTIPLEAKVRFVDSLLCALVVAG